MTLEQTLGYKPGNAAAAGAVLNYTRGDPERAQDAMKAYLKGIGTDSLTTDVLSSQNPGQISGLIRGYQESYERVVRNPNTVGDFYEAYKEDISAHAGDSVANVEADIAGFRDKTHLEIRHKIEDAQHAANVAERAGTPEAQEEAQRILNGVAAEIRWTNMLDAVEQLYTSKLATKIDGKYIGTVAGRSPTAQRT